jgi:RNA polymerase sigma-70 factor (ECF subfamily)
MSGDRSARFEALAAEIADPVHRYARRRTDPETAKEVLADTLLVLWRRVDEVPPEAELAWCYAVARRCLANAERSARRQQGLLARIVRVDPPVPTQPQEPDLPDAELQRALAQLSELDRELVRLWAWEDLAPREIAGVTGLTANAVSIRLHRARGRLAELLVAERSARKDIPTGGQKQAGRRNS